MANLGVILYSIYRENNKLTLISAKYGKLGRIILSTIQGKVHYLSLFRQNMANLAAPPPYLVYLFFYSIQGKRQLMHFYSFLYRENNNLFVFILFCIGKKTIFNKIQLNFDCNYCSIQFDKGEKGNKSVKKCIKIAKKANKINKCRAVPILLYTNLHYYILIYTILLYLI